MARRKWCPARLSDGDPRKLLCRIRRRPGIAKFFFFCDWRAAPDDDGVFVCVCVCVCVVRRRARRPILGAQRIFHLPQVRRSRVSKLPSFIATSRGTLRFYWLPSSNYLACVQPAAARHVRCGSSKAAEDLFVVPGLAMSSPAFVAAATPLGSRRQRPGWLATIHP